jgi:hypothetical protein
MAKKAKKQPKARKGAGKGESARGQSPSGLVRSRAEMLAMGKTGPAAASRTKKRDVGDGIANAAEAWDTLAEEIIGKIEEGHPLEDIQHLEIERCSPPVQLRLLKDICGYQSHALKEARGTLAEDERTINLFWAPVLPKLEEVHGDLDSLKRSATGPRGRQIVVSIKHLSEAPVTDEGLAKEAELPQPWDRNTIAQRHSKLKTQFNSMKQNLERQKADPSVQADPIPEWLYFNYTELTRLLEKADEGFPWESSLFGARNVYPNDLIQIAYDLGAVEGRITHKAVVIEGFRRRGIDVDPKTGMPRNPADIERLASEWPTLKAEMERLEKERDDRKKDANQTLAMYEEEEAKRRNAEKELKDLNMAMEGLSAELIGNRSDYGRLKEQLDTARQTVEEQKSALASSGKRAGELETKAADLHGEIDGLTRQLGEKEEEYRRNLAEERAAAREEADGEWRERVEGLEARLDELGGANESLRDENRKLSDQLQARLSEILSDGEIAQLKKEGYDSGYNQGKADAEAEARKILDEKLGEKDAEIEEFRGKFSAKSNAFSNLEAAMSGLRGRLRNSEGDNNRLRDDVKERDDMIDKISKLNKLMEQATRLEERVNVLGELHEQISANKHDDYVLRSWAAIEKNDAVRNAIDELMAKLRSGEDMAPPEDGESVISIGAVVRNALGDLRSQVDKAREEERRRHYTEMNNAIVEALQRQIDDARSGRHSQLASREALNDEQARFRDYRLATPGRFRRMHDRLLDEYLLELDKLIDEKGQHPKYVTRAKMRSEADKAVKGLFRDALAGKLDERGVIPKAWLDGLMRSIYRHEHPCFVPVNDVYEAEKKARRLVRISGERGRQRGERELRESARLGYDDELVARKSLDNAHERVTDLLDNKRENEDTISELGGELMEERIKHSELRESVPGMLKKAAGKARKRLGWKHADELRAFQGLIRRSSEHNTRLSRRARDLDARMWGAESRAFFSGLEDVDELHDFMDSAGMQQDSRGRYRQEDMASARRKLVRSLTRDGILEQYGITHGMLDEFVDRLLVRQLRRGPEKRYFVEAPRAVSSVLEKENEANERYSEMEKRLRESQSEVEQVRQAYQSAEQKRQAEQRAAQEKAAREKAAQDKPIQKPSHVEAEQGIPAYENEDAGLRSLYEDAQWARHDKQYGEALEMLRQVEGTGRFRRQDLLYAEIGVNFMLSKETNAAIAAFEKTLSSNPSAEAKRVAEHNLRRIYMDKGEKEKASKLSAVREGENPNIILYRLIKSGEAGILPEAGSIPGNAVTDGVEAHLVG